MTFPGAGAQIYRNEAGEPTGWDYPGNYDGRDFEANERDWEEEEYWRNGGDEPDSDEDEDPPVTYTLTIVRGEQPGAVGDELGLSPVTVTPELMSRLTTAGLDEQDTDMWVLVTPSNRHPGELRNVVESITVTNPRPTVGIEVSGIDVQGVREEYELAQQWYVEVDLVDAAGYLTPAVLWLDRVDGPIRITTPRKRPSDSWANVETLPLPEGLTVDAVKELFKQVEADREGSKVVVWTAVS